MGLIDVLMRDRVAPEYSAWNPNRPEPSDRLDVGIYRASKALTDLEAQADPKAKDVAEASIRIAKAITMAVGALRRDGQVAARWQAANFAIALAALVVSIVALFRPR